MLNIDYQPSGAFLTVPKDLGPCFLHHLSFKDLVAFGSTSRFAHQWVKNFLALPNVLPKDTASAPLYQRVQNLLEELKRKAIRFHLYLRLDFDFVAIKRDDFRAFLDSKALQAMPLLKRIEYLRSLPKVLRLLAGFQRLANNWVEEMPNFPMPFRAIDIAAIFNANRDDPIRLLEELYGAAKECEELLKLHEELLKARSILLVWNWLIELVPEEEHGDLISGPGLNQLTSTQEVLRKAKEFEPWFNLVKSTLINHANGGFRLNGFGLTYLPDQLCELVNLQHLNLGRNYLTTLPKGFENLTALHSLDLSWNFFDSLPDKVCQLTQLDLLNAGYNEISSIQGNIGTLARLGQLYLSNNRLTSLPLQIKGLVALWKLELQDNKLSSVFELRPLERLQHVDLKYNRLREFPVLAHSSINVLIDGNPIRSLHSTHYPIQPVDKRLLSLSILVLVGITAARYFNLF